MKIVLNLPETELREAEEALQYLLADTQVGTDVADCLTAREYEVLRRITEQLGNAL